MSFRQAWYGLATVVREYALCEVFLPSCPILIELVIKYFFPAIGQFNLFEKPLAITAIMVPLVAFVRQLLHVLTPLLFHKSATVPKMSALSLMTSAVSSMGIGIRSKPITNWPTCHPVSASDSDRQ